MNQLWEALSDKYLLRPKPGVIQLELPQVCIIPKNLTCCLQVYRFGDWVDVPTDRDACPFVHDIHEYPLPEYDSGFEYVLFIMQAFTEHISSGLSDVQTANSVDFVTYALVRREVK